MIPTRALSGSSHAGFTPRAQAHVSLDKAHMDKAHMDKAHMDKAHTCPLNLEDVQFKR